MKTKLPSVLLFTFPATYSYLLLITLPRSVVTKTQSNPPSSAWHHIDRHTLTHFVGELADSFIYFAFFFLRVKPCVRVRQAAFRTKDKQHGYETNTAFFLLHFYNARERGRGRKLCDAPLCVLALGGMRSFYKRTRAGCVKISRRCQRFVLFCLFPVVFSLLAVMQAFIPKVTSSPETMPHNLVQFIFHRAGRCS